MFTLLLVFALRVVVVRDFICFIVVTVTRLGQSGSWQLAFFILGAGTASSSISSRSPLTFVGFVIGVCLLYMSRIWRAAIVLLCAVEEARDSSDDVLAIHA